MAPLDLRRLFADPWEGEGVLWRPWWLRALPAPATFRFRTEITSGAGDSWEVRDATTLPDGTVRVRTMHCEQLAPDRLRLSAEDMPGGAEIRSHEDGFDFTPYVIRTPVLGPLRVPLRHHDRVRLEKGDAMSDTIELRLLGVRVGRVTMRLRRAPG